MKISIIIVNWNSGTQLFEAVNSISKYHCGIVALVVIVDNGSIDGSLKYIENLNSFPFEIHIIRNMLNYGFGVACNQGAALAKSELILFLNPDTKIFENSLTVPLSFFNNPQNKNVGIVGIQLVDEKNKVTQSCSRFPSPKIFLTQALGLNRLLVFKHLTQFMVDWDHSTTKEVNQVMGAFLMIRQPLFKTLGGFDERFFVYFEEVDLSYRAHRAGWKSVYLSDAKTYHAGNGTSNQVKAKRLFYSLRSRILFCNKHFSKINTFIVALITVFIEPISRSSLSIYKKDLLSLKETWSAYFMLYKWLPKWITTGVTR